MGHFSVPKFGQKSVDFVTQDARFFHMEMEISVPIFVEFTVLSVVFGCIPKKSV